MSRGPGTHQREILQRLDAGGWVWLRDLPYVSPADRTSYWRAALRLKQIGRLRIEKRTRYGYFAPWTLLVSVTHTAKGSALPIDEPYWRPEVLARVDLRLKRRLEEFEADFETGF